MESHAAMQASIKVLIVEDDIGYADEVQKAFESNYKGLQFDVSVIASASEAEPFIHRDQIHVYLVDLELPEFEGPLSERVGEELVKKIVQRASGGVIINTHSLRTDREDFLWDGVDDYVLKGDSVSELVARTFAVWRRVKNAQQSKRGTKATRTFKLGKWRFELDNRNLIANDGERVRLSATELAFIQYLCTVDTKIDRREFNVAVLGRLSFDEDKRIDNLVYRLRNKLGGSFQLASRHDSEGTYKLISFEETSS